MLPCEVRRVKIWSGLGLGIGPKGKKGRKGKKGKKWPGSGLSGSASWPFVAVAMERRGCSPVWRACMAHGAAQVQTRPLDKARDSSAFAGGHWPGGEGVYPDARSACAGGGGSGGGGGGKEGEERRGAR
jgi:hypothetical protein